MAVVMFDIDYFKTVNDQLGHLAGDKVLKEVAQLLSASVRKGDCLGRWGGEEFVVLLPSSDARAAAVIAERIRRVIASTTFADELRITASFGYAEYRSDESLVRWIGRADAALYLAKNAGRNLVHYIP